jgi:hypothetical protein
MAYTAEEKAIAIALVERYGGMTHDALADIRQALGRSVSTGTLHSWVSKTEIETGTEKLKLKKPTPGAVVSLEMQASADTALDALFEQVARRYLSHALQDETIKGTKGKDAVIAAATAVDKMRLLRDLPTEIVQVLPTLMLRLEALNISPSDYFNAHLQELDRVYHEQSHPGG